MNTQRITPRKSFSIHKADRQSNYIPVPDPEQSVSKPDLAPERSDRSIYKLDIRFHGQRGELCRFHDLLVVREIEMAGGK